MFFLLCVYGAFPNFIASQISLMGTTFLISSGDTGVSGFGGVCLSEDGTERESGGPTFAPLVVNSCPFVTSVGATQVKTGVPVSLIICNVHLHRTC